MCSHWSSGGDEIHASSGPHVLFSRRMYGDKDQIMESECFLQVLSYVTHETIIGGQMALQEKTDELRRLIQAPVNDQSRQGASPTNRT